MRVNTKCANLWTEPHTLHQRLLDFKCASSSPSARSDLLVHCNLILISRTARCHHLGQARLPLCGYGAPTLPLNFSKSSIHENQRALAIPILARPRSSYYRYIYNTSYILLYERTWRVCIRIRRRKLVHSPFHHGIVQYLCVRGARSRRWRSWETVPSCSGPGSASSARCSP